MSINYENQVLDFLDEKVASNLDLGFVYEEPESDRGYALILKTASGTLKKFPINTIENASFSCVSFEKNASKLTPEMRKIAENYIAKSLTLFNVDHQLKEHEDVNSNVYKVANADLRVSKVANDPRLFAYDNKLPIDTAENLNKSANEFIKQASYLSVKEKKEIAFELVKRASELNISLPQAIYKFAAYTPVSYKQMKTAMASRMKAYPAKVRTYVSTILENVKSADDVVKVASAIEELDKKYHIITPNHPDLSKEFFTTEKTAEEKRNDKIRRTIEAGILGDYIDKEAIDLLTENPNNYNQLKDIDKMVIDKILKNIN